MIVLQQIRNLLYATITTSWEHLPHFFALLGLPFILVVLFLGIAILVTTKKREYLIPSYYYIAITLYVVLADVFARIGTTFITATILTSVILLTVSLFGYWKKREDLLTWSKYLQNHIFKWIILLGVVVLSTFFFSKFIFNNGLHDEYQHHAAVEDMLLQGSWPIRDELRYGIDLSDYYHYGWYYLVILTTLVTHASIEVSLDIVKLILFLPLLPLFYSLIRKFFQTRWYISASIAVLLLVQGPALFFLDAYSGNVLFSQGNKIVYEPLFFQLAGITWFGIILLMAFSAVMDDILRKSFSIKTILLPVFFTWSLFILNKAFLLIFIATLLLLYLNTHQDMIESLLQKYKKIWLLALLTFPLIGMTLYFGIKMSSPIFFTLLKGNNGIPFIRSFELWGFPYSSNEGLAFQSIFSLDSVRAFGTLPFISGSVLLWSLLRKKNIYTTLLLMFFWLFLWIVPVILNFSGSELALNKFYIPALWLSVLITIHSLLQQKKAIQMVSIVLLFSALFAPLLYFASISLPDRHHYWNYSDSIIEYLSDDESMKTIAISDFEYAKYIINNANVEMISVHISNDSIANITEYEVTTEKHIDEEPLAQTETHYLYAR